MRRPRFFEGERSKTCILIRRLAQHLLTGFGPRMFKKVWPAQQKRVLRCVCLVKIMKKTHGFGHTGLLSSSSHAHSTRQGQIKIYFLIIIKHDFASFCVNPIPGEREAKTNLCCDCFLCATACTPQAPMQRYTLKFKRGHADCYQFLCSDSRGPAQLPPEIFKRLRIIPFVFSSIPLHRRLKRTRCGTQQNNRNHFFRPPSPGPGPPRKSRNRALRVRKLN